MEQVEGVVMQAQKSAQATGQDVVLAVNGTWTASGTPSLSGTSPLLIEPRRFQDPASSPDPYTGARVGSDSEQFVSFYRRGNRDHLHAGVATDSVGIGFASSLSSAVPFSTTTSFQTALSNPLCNGAPSAATVNGISHRFNTGFCIVIVGLTSGAPASGGPVGVLVVPADSANVYRFYKSAGETTWKRI
jgi:hypothetical protein